MNEVFSVIALAEISAQAVDFGPFDSVDTLQRLKEKLSALRMDKCLGIKKLIESNHFQFDVPSAGEKKIDINLGGIEDFKTLRSATSKAKATPKKRYKKLLKQYTTWLVKILEEFDDYLKLPKAVPLACENFKESITMDYRFGRYKKFFKLTETQFELCKENCQKLLCMCAEEEFRKFFKEYKKETQREIHREIERKRKNPDDKTPRKTTKEILISFLDPKHKIAKLSRPVTNCLRICETISLLKPNQSTCERTISALESVVKGK